MGLFKSEPKALVHCYIVYVLHKFNGTISHFGMFEGRKSARYTQVGLERRYENDEDCEVVYKTLSTEEAMKVFAVARKDQEEAKWRS